MALCLRDERIYELRLEPKNTDQKWRTIICAVFRAICRDHGTKCIASACCNLHSFPFLCIAIDPSINGWHSLRYVARLKAGRGMCSSQCIIELQGEFSVAKRRRCKFNRTPWHDSYGINDGLLWWRLSMQCRTLFQFQRRSVNQPAVSIPRYQDAHCGIAKANWSAFTTYFQAIPPTQSAANSIDLSCVLAVFKHCNA